MMLDDELVEALDFMPLDQPYPQIIQDLLFIDSGLSMTDFILTHAQQDKKSIPVCPVKSINPPCLSNL